MPEPLRIRLLGGFQVSIGARSVPEGSWRLKKAASLVKLLALAEGHRLHQEQVMEWLWRDLAPDAASNNLRQALHAARRALEPEPSTALRYLRMRDGQLALCPGEPLWVDVEAFERAAWTARGTEDPAAYLAALNLYAGELLPEDRYEAWAEQKREPLRQIYITLLMELATLYEEQGDQKPAITALGRVVEIDPAHEDAQVGLMRLYAASGRRREAILQYRRLRRKLSRELSAEPGEPARRLYERIVAGRLPKTSSSEGEVVTPAGRPTERSQRHNLPAERTSFVGREDETVEVERLLSMTRLLTLTGAGGAGKTRFALRVARRLVGTYPDGVWMAELAPLPHGVLVEQAVAEAVGVREEPDRPLVATLKNHLAARRTLLLLDNCEHLIDVVAGLTETLLDSCQELRILATSREALNVAGELTWRVEPLPVPDTSRRRTVEDVAGYESVRLFVDRARYRRPGFALTEDNAGSVAKVCRTLEGIPLALELAAARVGAMSVEWISERLADSQFLSGSRTAPARQRSLEGTLDWSLGLLSKEERELFGRLSVFAGGWALGAAEAVGAGGSIKEDEVLELLLGLVDKSLVVAEADGKDRLRYRMLEPIRQYGQKRLEESGERVRRRHAEYYLALVEEAEPKLVGAEQGMWLDLLETEIDNLRAAIGWSAQAGEPEMGLRFAGALLRFCYLRGRYHEGREWFKGVLSRGGASPAPLRAKALFGVGYLLFLQCEYDRGKALLQQSAALYRELEDKRGLASALRGLASVEREQGRYGRARTLHEDSMSLWREVGDEAGVADTLAYLAMAAWLEGDHGRAGELGTEALVMCRRLRDTHGTICALIVLGAEAHHTGDYERSEELLQESLLLSREGLREGVPFSLHQLGIAAHRRGEQDRARSLLEDSLVLHRDVGDRWRMASVLEGLAEVSCSLGDHERAGRLFGAAESLRKEIGAPLPACERADYEQSVAAARAGLEEEVLDAVWSEGKAMTPDQAVEYALSSTQPQITNPEQPLVDRKQEEALTRRERQIAELVARELTNRRISEELVISEHTVATHVRHILKKLDLRSRTQVADWVRERKLLP